MDDHLAAPDNFSIGQIVEAFHSKPSLKVKGGTWYNVEVLQRRLDPSDITKVEVLVAWPPEGEETRYTGQRWLSVGSDQLQPLKSVRVQLAKEARAALTGAKKRRKAQEKDDDKKARLKKKDEKAREKAAGLGSEEAALARVAASNLRDDEALKDAPTRKRGSAIVPSDPKDPREAMRQGRTEFRTLLPAVAAADLASNVMGARDLTSTGRDFILLVVEHNPPPTDKGGRVAKPRDPSAPAGLNATFFLPDRSALSVAQVAELWSGLPGGGGAPGSTNANGAGSLRYESPSVLLRSSTSVEQHLAKLLEGEGVISKKGKVARVEKAQSEEKSPPRRVAPGVVSPDRAGALGGMSPCRAQQVGAPQARLFQ